MATSGSKKVIIAALAGNSLIAVTKLIASVVTGSSAMLSEGIHSIVDTGNQILLLFGLHRSHRPANPRFPFGHGKEVYFWSFVVAILIFAVGAGVSLYEGIRHIAHPRHITNPNLNYVVLGVSFLFEAGAWFFAWHEFAHVKGKQSYLRAVQESKDPTTFVVLFEDSAAMLGIVTAFLGIFLGQVTGATWLDGAASVVIGLLLAGTAAWLAWETKGMLIGESARPEVVAGIRNMSRGLAGVERVNEVLTLHMGPEFILVNLSVDFRDDRRADEIETTIARLDARIKERWPRVKKVFVEIGKAPSTSPGHDDSHPVSSADA